MELKPAPANALMKAALTPATPWREVLTVFLDTLNSPHTRRGYQRYITQALEVSGVGSLAELTGGDLAALRWSITNSAEAGPGTRAFALAALRSFIQFARRHGAYPLSAVAVAEALKGAPATVNRPYSVASEPEISAMLHAAGSPRDRAMLAVFLGAGLRVAEVVGLDVSDLREDLAGGLSLYVRQGKGRKDRTVPIQPDVAKLLRGYLALTGRHMGGPGPLFLAEDRATRKAGTARRMTTRAVEKLVVKVATAAGIEAKHLTPHALRHTYALRALRHGGNVMAVGKLLGHASIATTQRYVDHLATAELREAVPALPEVE